MFNFQRIFIIFSYFYLIIYNLQIVTAIFSLLFKYLSYLNGSQHSSDILVIEIILVLVLVSFQSNHFYFI